MNKKWTKIIGIASIVAVLGVAALGAVAYAQDTFGRMGFGPRGFHNGEGFGPDGFFEGGPGFDRGGFGPAAEFAQHGPGPHGPRGGVGGEVTAKTDTNLTVQNRDGDSITVNVNEDTHVMLAETQTEGSLDDVTVGSNVGVRGPRNDDGSVDARDIVVLPAGDMAGGRVTTVDGSTITVENPKDGEATIVTNDSTTFRLNRDEEGALSDVAVDKHVVAFGETQEDGSILARLVLIHDGPPPGGWGRGAGRALDQLSNDAYGARAGSRTMKVVPLPSVLSAVIVPP